MNIRQDLKYKEFLRFEELRVDSDLKQSEIADIINVKRNTYSKWENCINDMPLEKSNQLANYYNVDLDYILGLTNNIKKKSELECIDLDLLSTRLKEIRKDMKLTQKELSDKVGFHLSTYTKYENGINIPTTIKLLAISMFYNVSIDYLTGRKNTKEINSL